MTMGRPRTFDIDNALESALQVFWRKGYEGTSLADLTEAMGINKPSLYAAFGNKEALFHKILNHYVEGPAAYVYNAMKEHLARTVVEQLLLGTIRMLTDPHTPPKCLIVQCTLAGGEEADPIRKEAVTRLVAGEVALRHRLEQAQVDGDLPADCEPADLACYIMTVTDGLTVQAARGASYEELLRVMKTALQAWPT